MTFIQPDQTFLIWSIIFLSTAAAIRLERTSFGQKLSGPIIVIILGALFTNLGILPRSNQAFGAIWTIGVPIAMVLMLFGANLKRILTESGPTLIAFCIGALGTTIGAIASYNIISLESEGPAVTAVMSATYIGGSLNFAAVAESIGFDDGSLLTAALAADNVVGVSFLAVLIALPSIRAISRWFPDHQPGSEVDQETAEMTAKPFDPLRAVISVTIGFLVIGIADLAASAIDFPGARLIIATSLIVAVASLAHSQLECLEEAFPIGMVIMYMFFFMVGAGVDLSVLLHSGLKLAAMAAIILATHFLVLLAGCRLLKLSLPEMVIGSNACVLGPPTAAAMAGANGWNHLITPAILCGTLGYAMANFIGVTLFTLLS